VPVPYFQAQVQIYRVGTGTELKIKAYPVPVPVLIKIYLQAHHALISEIRYPKSRVINNFLFRTHLIMKAWIAT
jgi:hypothetical protein